MVHFGQTTCVAGVAMRSICLKLVLWSWNCLGSAQVNAAEHKQACQGLKLRR